MAGLVRSPGSGGRPRVGKALAHTRVPAAAGSLRPGAILGKYRIVKLVGRGGMGAVYQGIHVDLGAPFAIKTLATEHAQDPTAQARFLREATSASRIRHPHVAHVSDYGSALGTVFLVMDYFEGEDLGRLVARTRLAEEQTADLLLPICSALVETHEVGVIHRDIKPSNIFLARNRGGRIVPTLVDFGLARTFDSEGVALTKPGTVVGTPAFLSPEQVRLSPATARSDQYALGVVLYQCLTGRQPFNGPTSSAIMKAILSRSFLPIRDLVPGIAPSFEALVFKAMAERPGGRFDSVRDLARALVPFASPPLRSMWRSYFGMGESSHRSLTDAVTIDTSTSGWDAADKGRTKSHAASPRRPRSFVGLTLAILGLSVAGLAWAAMWTRSRDQRSAPAEIQATTPSGTMEAATTLVRNTPVIVTTPTPAESSERKLPGFPSGPQVTDRRGFRDELTNVPMEAPSPTTSDLPPTGTQPETDPYPPVIRNEGSTYPAIAE